MKIFPILMGLLAIAGCSGSAPSNGTSATTSTDNAATRYVEGLQYDIQKTKSVTDQASQMDQEREKQIKELANQ